MSAQAVDMGLLERWTGRTEKRVETLSETPAVLLAATLDRPGPAPRAGDALPLPWHWLYFLPTAASAELGEDGHPRTGGFLPPVPLPRRMWAGSRIATNGRIAIGDTLTRESTITSVTHKRGASGDLVFVQVRHALASQTGASLVEEQDIVYREAPAAGGSSASARKQARTDHAWMRRVMPGPTLLFRYSALTFNSHRIHYDRPYATQVEAYPGLVVHGPLLATLLLDHACRSLPGISVTRFEFRAVSPLFDTRPFFLCAARTEGKNELALWASDEDGMLATEARLEFEAARD